MNRDDVQRALDGRLSSIECNEKHIRHVLDQVRGEPMMKKKISFILVILIVSILLAVGIAVAASRGVFAQFAQFEGDEYLNSLDQFAKEYDNQTVHIKADQQFPEVTFTLNQAHYDGQLLFSAYTLTAPWIPVTFMDPADAFLDGNDIRSEQYHMEQMPFYDYVISPDDLDLIQQKIATEGKIYFEASYQTVQDSYVFSNDIKIEGNRSNLQRMPNGTTIGYSEFKFPLPREVQDQAVLNLDYIFHYGSFQFYMDETGVYEKRLESSAIQMPVTIEKSAESDYVQRGYKESDGYSISAMMHVSDFAIKVDVLIRGTEEKIVELDKQLEQSRLHGNGLFSLFAGDEKCKSMDGSGYNDGTSIDLRMTFERPSNLSDFRVVLFEKANDPQADGTIPMVEILHMHNIIQLGIDDQTMKSYKGQPLFGVYNTYTRSWQINQDYTNQAEIEPVLPPPADAVCLITEYEGDQFTGFRVISNEAFFKCLPTRMGGLEAFDEKYGQYKPFGFDRYAYGGKNVRGFWDDKTKTSLLNIDPSTGDLLLVTPNEAEYAVYLEAVYDDVKLVGLNVLSEEAFIQIEGIQDEVLAIQQTYFNQ